MNDYDNDEIFEQHSESIRRRLAAKRECPPLVVFDKTNRCNRTVLDQRADEHGIRWFMFMDDEWVCEKDTEAAT